MKNRIISISLAVVLALSVGLIGCGSEEVPEYSLTISTTEGGEVTDPGDGIFSYDEGTVVPLVALPHTGYRFVNWTGDVDTIDDVNAPSTTITMNDNYSITANFVAEYVLTIDSTDGGEVTVPGEGAFAYDAGAVVHLVAEPEEGYHFVNWTGDLSTIADVNSASTTITMDNQYSITANFDLGVLVRDWYDLDAIRDNLGGSYILMNDLDSATPGYTGLVSATANQGKGWEPIGTWDDRFAGSFDGQGYEIRDLFINRPSGFRVGLFGAIHAEGTINNIGVVNATVIGGYDVGSLVGWNNGTVSNSYCSGNVTGTGDVGALEGWNDSVVGGLIGDNSGTVSNSYSTGSVTGQGWVGGLVGQSGGTIGNSCSSAEVVGSDILVGGLVGYSCATVNNCYATGQVTGDVFVGGLIGKNEGGSVSNSYSAGSVTGSAQVGGLMGSNGGKHNGRIITGVLSNSYSTGSVTGSYAVGGLLGVNYGTVSNSFWDIQTSGQTTSAGGTGRTTTQMQSIATFTDWNMMAVADPGTREPSYIWNIVDGATYPFLSWQS